MPLCSGWSQLTQQIYNELLPEGQTWSNGLPYLNFTKLSSRTKIDSLVATYGWSNMIGIFCSGDGGPIRVPDFILHKTEFPIITIPSAPFVSSIGNTGNRTYSYVIQGLNVDDKVVSPLSLVGSIANGNVNLNGTNYNVVSWNAVDNATKYQIFRTVNTGNNPTTGKLGLIATVNTTTLNDTGLIGDGILPSNVTELVCIQNVLDNIIKNIYVGAFGARSIWLNTHFWNYRPNRTLYTPRIDKQGDFNINVSDDPPGNPPWWKYYD